MSTESLTGRLGFVRAEEIDDDPDFDMNEMRALPYSLLTNPDEYVRWKDRCESLFHPNDPARRLI
jgi:hypothetical protein